MGARVATFLLLTAAFASIAARNGSVGELAFELHRGHLIVVHGVGGGFDDLDLLLDTGASRTLLSTSVAAALGLRGQTTTVETFGRTMVVSEAVIPELHFGPIHLERHRVLVTDLSTTAGAIGLGRLDGIVGVDVLGRTSFAIDYRRRRVMFGARSPTRHRVPLRADPLFPVVSVALDGEQADLIVDTGASHLVLFRRTEESRRDWIGEASASGLAGPMGVRGIVLPDVRIGPWRARDVPLLFADAPTTSSSRARGLLPPTVLGSSYVQFDFERREFGWRP